MRKVLLIKLEGAQAYSSIGMEAAFHQTYEQVHSIDWQRVNLESGGDKTLLWQRIKRECEALKPELIFCQFQRSVLTPEQFKELSEYGFVINYTEDVRVEGSLEMEWHESVAPYCLSIFTNKDACRSFWGKGLRAAYMMVSYNHFWYRPQPQTTKDYGDIVFVGNNSLGNNLNFPLSQERVDMCKFMKEKFGDKFQAYGMGQENQMINPPQVVEAYNNAKVVITHNHFKREGYCSDRGMNAMGCGAITIHQYFEGIEEMFTDMLYLSYWKNFEQLEEKCIRLLNDEVKQTVQVKKNIADYIMKDHSWFNRIKFIKGFIKLQIQET